MKQSPPFENIFLRKKLSFAAASQGLKNCHPSDLRFHFELNIMEKTIRHFRN